MNTLELNPNQIITLNDYPVHSDSALSEYYKKCRLVESVPFVPVIRKEIIRKYLEANLQEEFERFESQNPVAIALDNCCAIEVVDDKFRIIKSKPNAKAYKIFWKGGKYFKEDIISKNEFESLEMLLSK